MIPVMANHGVGLGHLLVRLGQDQLDMAGVGHVRVDLREESATAGKSPPPLPSQKQASMILLGLGMGLVRGGYIHDREHGMSVVAAWGPGSPGCA